MYHYVYLLKFQNGKKYLGCHSTIIEPELDACYLCSGGSLPKDRDIYNTEKIILKSFSTREEAIAYEIKMIRDYDAVKSEEFLNMRESCHDRYGSNLSEEHKQHIRETSTGRIRHELRGKYLKANGTRTPAQKANDLKMSIESRGIKNPKKAKHGIENGGFNPWYYITPEGEYVEVLDTTKADKAEELGFTYRQLQHGFHYSNEHKKSNRLPRKGWTFGNLPRPEVGEE